MLKNPVTGGQHWFHGTPNTFGSFRSTEDLDKQQHSAWNSGLGHHFTSLHEVANQFVTGGNGEHNPNGWHIHAKLGIENPKHYASEHDMLHHAAQVLDPANEHQRVFHHDGKVHDIPVSSDENGPLSTETHLKMRPKSAKRFREHLIRQGHDGVTYGNEFEGPKKHTCAIAFHKDQIKEADRHAGHAPDLPDSHIAKKKRHDNSHHVKHKHHRVSHSPGWPGYHPWCTGFYMGGGYIAHDGSCPAHDGGGGAISDGGSGGDGGSVGGGGDGGGSMGSHRLAALDPQDLIGLGDSRDWHEGDAKGTTSDTSGLYHRILHLHRDHGHKGLKEMLDTMGHGDVEAAHQRAHAFEDSKRDGPMGKYMPGMHDHTHRDFTPSDHAMHSLNSKSAAFADDEYPRLYHSTFQEFAPGTRLVPPAKRKDKITHDHPQGEQWRNHRVWMTDTPEEAHAWNDHGSKAHVYEVKPVGVKPHETTNYDYEADHAHGDDQFQGRGAEVIRKVPHEEMGCCGPNGPRRRTAAVLTDWKPTERLFAPTKETVDPRLFDANEKMRPEVRKVILDGINNQWRQYGDWSSWARVYLAGSEASKWWGNNDFDILVGVNYDAFRKAQPKHSGLSNKEITDAFNRGFSATYNNEEWHPPFRPDEVWHRTGYVNLNSWDIRDIKPYAAYNVGDDIWAVTPPDEPQGHQFDQSAIYYAEGVAEQIKNVMRLTEPERSQQAKRLWTFLHEDRSRAFGPNGTGAYDRGNMVEKYLDQAGLWEELVRLKFGKTAGSKTYWRAHPKDRPFSVEDAKSREWGTSDDHDEGYSSFEHPHELVGYFNPGERDKYADSHVVSFSGHPVGEGMDGEPLVKPDMKHVQHHSWDDLHALVGHDKVKDINRRNGWDKTANVFDGMAKDPHDFSECKSYKADPSFCLWHKSDHLTNQGEPHPDLDGNAKPSQADFDPPRCDLCSGFHDTLRHHDSETTNQGPDENESLKGLPTTDHSQDGPSPTLYRDNTGGGSPWPTISAKTASEWESEGDLKKRMDANHALNEHLALHHQGLVQEGKSHAVLDMYHRISHGTVGPQQQLELEGEGYHQHDDLIDPRQPFSVRHKTSAIKLRCTDCETDYFTDGEPHDCAKTAAVRKQKEGPNGEDADGIMIAIVPPASIVEGIVLEEGERPENLHITLAYLGKISEHSEAQLDMLPELVEAWAEGEKKLEARVQGAGTFVNDGSHVLWAAADMPGSNEMYVSLMQYLKGHGFDPKQNHGFTPHITLAYGTSHFRFLPKIEPTTWKVREVWCCIGSRWESFPLKG